MFRAPTFRNLCRLNVHKFFAMLNFEVNAEDDKVLVIKTQGKQKHENEEEESKILRMERNTNPKFVRKFALLREANMDSIFVSCVDGVLTFNVPKIPPMDKSKIIEIAAN
eukprot:Gb_02607 [translate_table: standard]